MKKGLLLVMFLNVTLFSIADTVVVSSIPALQQAIDKAKPGDIILLADGIYSAADQIKVSCIGTAAAPVTIAAQHKGAADISGKAGFSIISPATHVIIRDFRFTHQASGARSASGTSFCHWLNNIFETPGKGEYLTIAGSDHEIGYNTFRNKNSMGRVLAIRGEGSQVAERIHIHHNYFHDFPDQGGANGAETLQFGLSGFSLSTSNSIVEFNLFERCAGENELISVKASGVILRYNTIRDCPAQVTVRQGNHNQVYGNYFFNTPGLRFFGDDHFIFSNYFTRCNPAIMIGNGGAEVADGAPLTSHDRPDRVLIAFNTLVDNIKNILQTPRKDGLGSTYITVADNIIQGGDVAAAISGPNTNPVWKNNWFYKVKSAGDVPKEGFVQKDPRLVKDVNGIFQLAKGSPAIGAGDGQYSMVNVDMDGQVRKGKWDIGADQYSDAPPLAHPLSPSEVGARFK